MRERKAWGWLRVSLAVTDRRAWQVLDLGIKIRKGSTIGYYAPPHVACILAANELGYCLNYEATRALKRTLRDKAYVAAIDSTHRTGGTLAVGSLVAQRRVR